MSKYQEFQQKMENVSANCGYSSKDVAALKYKQLLEEVLEEFKRLEGEEIKIKSDREGIQDWDGGESRYQAYLEEFGLDGYDEREEVYYRDEFVEEDDEEVTDDDENCWVEYLPPTD